MDNLEAIDNYPQLVYQAKWWLEIAGYKVEPTIDDNIYIVYFPDNYGPITVNKAWIIETGKCIWREYYEPNNRQIP